MLDDQHLICTRTLLLIICHVGCSRQCSDPISQYVSLLSLSNVSVLVLIDRFYGFYVHGRSVHNRADCNVLEIANQIKQEENGLAPKRSLGASSEEQVSNCKFTVTVGQFQGLCCLRWLKFGEQL